MNKVKVWIFKCWKNSLFEASVLGLVFAVITYYIAARCDLADERLKISVTFLVLSLSFLFLWIFRIYDTQKQLSKRIIGWILNHRKISLLGAGFLGLILAFVIYDIATYCCLKHEVLKSSITILALGLPTFFTLWMFRTHDVQEQLKKTEENTNNNTFFECVRMLMFEAPPESDEKDRIKNSFHKKVALEQLAYLKRETGFDKKRIDLLTKSLSSLNTTELNYARLSGINLSDMNLIGISLIDADLSNADLSNADLSNADLSNADLSNADLSDTNLSRTNLSRTDLSNADLSRANLSGAKLAEAKLKGAIYNDQTIFEGTVFESEEARDNAGMIYKPDEYDPKI